MDKNELTLGAVLFDGFELLDLYGPLEMFGALAYFEGVSPSIKMLTIAEKAGPVRSFQGPQTVADFCFQTGPPLDLLLLPGGLGAFNELNNPAMLSFLKERVPNARFTMSVCSGSWILAKAGLLDGRRATSNKAFFEVATQQSKKVEWLARARWVEDGSIFTASGVSAGIDMSLAVLASMYGEEQASMIAVGAEYCWNQDPDNDPFTKYLNTSSRYAAM